MNNKQKLINTIDNDFNKNNNLNIINKKIDKSYKFNNILKYAFVPSLILICFILYSSINKKEIALEDNNNNNLIDTSQNIIINNVNIPIIKNNPWEDSTTTEKGVKYKVIDKLDNYDFYKNLNISNEYNAFIMYEVYVKENKEDTEFTKLNNYLISFKVKKEDKFKDIEIAFSKENEPISNYEYKNIDIKTSKINNIDVKIYKSDNIYMSVFKYDNINFNITTCNLDQSELLYLLNSIIL